jgi:hypothetical protein
MLLSRQAFHRLTNFALFIQIATLRSPGFSRIGLSWQDAAVPAGISPANEFCIVHPDIDSQESRLQPDRAFLAVYRCPGRHFTG